MKWYYPLFILILFLAPSCAVTSTAPVKVDVVLAHLGDVHAFDMYSAMVNLKLQALSNKGHLKDKKLHQKLKNYNDAVYAYYTRAFVLLAAGDIEGYRENLDKAWSISQAMEKIADKIYSKIKDTTKEGQGL